MNLNSRFKGANTIMTPNRISFNIPPNFYSIVADPRISYSIEGETQLWDISLIGVNPNSGHEDYLDTLASDLITQEKDSLMNLFTMLNKNANISSIS